MWRDAWCIGKCRTTVRAKASISLLGRCTAFCAFHGAEHTSAPDFQYSSDLLRALHFMIARAEANRNPGRWRPGDIYIKNDATGEIVYEGPTAGKVPKLMRELCEHLTQRDDETSSRMLRASMAHLNLVMIHPFSDGNGRMARCLHTLVLARGGVLNSAFSSIEEYLGQNTSEYYKVLAPVGQGSWQPKNDTLPWIRFCLTAHYRQARSVQRRIERVAQYYESAEEMLTRLKLPERAATSLVNATMGYVVRNEDYRRDADVSKAMASRDLKHLADASLLDAIGEKRGRHYKAGDDLRKVAATFHRRDRIPDPYELV